MSDPDVKYKQAVAAYKAGQKDQARTLLMEIVAEHEHHEQAWLLLSGLVDTLDEQQICLENVVAINPANDRARQGLDTVNQKIAARDRQAPPSPQAPPVSPIGADFATTPDNDIFANSPWATPAQQAPPSPQVPPASPIGADFATAPDNDIFANSPWATPAQQTPDPGVSDNDWLPFNTSAPSPDPFGSPATSVDWGRSDGPAAYGSGKQVELPSNQEYDDWVQGLNLGGSSSAVPDNAPFQDNMSFQDNTPFQTETPFGDTSFMIESDANSFLASPPPASPPVDPFGRNELFANEPNPWGVDSAPFAEESDSGFPDSSTPFGDPVSPSSVPAFQGFAESDFPSGGPFVLDENSAKGISRFDFDAADEDDDLWPDASAIAPQQTAVPVFASKQGPLNVQAEAYFRYIPDDIEPELGGIERQSLLMLAGIAALVVLNLISFGVLLV